MKHRLIITALGILVTTMGFLWSLECLDSAVDCAALGDWGLMNPQQYLIVDKNHLAMTRAQELTGTPSVSLATFAPSLIASENDLNLTAPDMLVPPLDPVQVFDEWKRHHGKQALRQENVNNRKFILTQFACPRQAGMHALFYTNALLLAMATNRSLLVEYKSLGKWVQVGESTPEICRRILKPSEWMMWYEDFPELHDMNVTGLDPMQTDGPLEDRADQGLPLHKNISKARIIKAPLFRLGRIKKHFAGWMDLRDVTASTYFSHAFGIHPPLHQQERIHKLYSQGPNFLYGMLFWESFQFTDAILESVRHDLIDIPPNAFTIGMHSRHSEKQYNNGTNIEREVACFEQLLRDYYYTDNNTRPCFAFLMSDRRETIQRVATFLQTNHSQCRVVSTRHRQTVNPNASHVVEEHGAFAGYGYFQDVVVVGLQASSAFVSHRRSSSALVLELMEYERRLHAWEMGMTVEDEIPECRI